MFFSMIVSLYTSRLILSTLGITDFGIYSVVGGVVTLFSFLNSAMAVSTQRFLTFEIGKGNKKILNNIFSISVNLHLCISLIVLLIAETIGVWFLNNKLKIPYDRIVAANWVFQFSVFTLILTILSVPYNALIIAREKMNIFAYIGILEVFLKLLIVYLLFITDFDKLILFSALVFIVSLVIRIMYQLYCRKNYPESHYKFYWEKNLFKQMASFAGWNLIGVFAGLAQDQGINVILNIFFGPIINAARGIGVQVNNSVTNLVINFQTAINPPITKAYATGEMFNQNKLVFFSSKLSFFLIFIFSLPLILNADIVLGLWLKKVPENTIFFVNLGLINIMIGSISGPLQILAQATGKVKYYQIIVSSILLMDLPIAYLILWFGFNIQIVLWSTIVISVIALVARLYILKFLVSFSISEFFNEVINPILKVFFLSSILPVICIFYLESVWVRFFLIILSSVISIIFFVWVFGINKSERENILLFANQIIKRRKKNDFI